MNLLTSIIIMLEIRDLFMLLCAAFNQPRYHVDKQLNVLPNAE